MTGAAVAGPSLVRRLTLSRAEIDVLADLLPGDLPGPLMPTRSDPLAGPAADEPDTVVADLTAAGVLVDGEVVGPFARTWSILAGSVTAVELMIAGRGPIADNGIPVGQHVWISLDAESAASMRAVDAHRVEVSAFLTAGLAAELDGLIPGPGEFGPRRPVSIADALNAPVGAAMVDQDLQTVSGDSPEAGVITRAAHATLRCTVMTRTPRGPGVGALTWIATPTAWWQVDQDWRRCQRSGERENEMTRVPSGQVLAAQVRRLLRAADGLDADGGVARWAMRIRRRSPTSPSPAGRQVRRRTWTTSSPSPGCTATSPTTCTVWRSRSPRSPATVT